VLRDDLLTAHDVSAEERFHLLLEASRELIDSVTQKDIAHYLGITPVALSRIRGRDRR